MNEVKLGSDTYSLNVDEKLRPSVERALVGRTALDVEIDSLPIPESPFQRKKAILLLRWYRNRLSPKLGHRCVLDPSCSRYCEAAIRNVGLFKGIILTVKRLFRCNPKNGGQDLPPVK